jgi:hypothetical protein
MLTFPCSHSVKTAPSDLRLIEPRNEAKSVSRHSED